MCLPDFVKFDNIEQFNPSIEKLAEFYQCKTISWQDFKDDQIK